MTLLPEQEDQIRRYLLGVATPDEVTQVELDLLRGDGSVEHLLLIEDELIADYARGALTEREMEALAKNFFTTPERRERLMIAREMVKEASAHGDGGLATLMDAEMNETRAKRATGTVRQSRPGIEWARAPFTPGWRIGVYAALTLVAALGIWRWRTGSEIDKAIASLNQAYSAQRLVKARVTGLNHAPYFEERGSERSLVDTIARGRAERLLLDEVSERPSAAAHHALGRLYLSEKKFEQAVKQFEESLKTNPNNAGAHSDLGAVLLEKIRNDGAAETNKDLPVIIDRAFFHLNKAVELDREMKEALFNRALLYQTLNMYQPAREGWEMYLIKDSASPWAVEANQNLEDLRRKSERGAAEPDTSHEVFLQARQSGDDEKAWQSYSRSHLRHGNHITGKLIDSFLELSARGQKREANAALQNLVYLGQLCERKAGDRFTSFLAAAYNRATAKQRMTLAEAREMRRQAYLSSGKTNHDRAIELSQAARALFVQAGVSEETLVTEYWIGECYLRQSKHQKSLAAFKQIAREFERNGYKWWQALTYNRLANVHGDLEEFSDAKRYCLDARQRFSQMEDENGVLRTLITLSSLHRESGGYYDSIALARQALLLADRLVADDSWVINPYAISAWSFNELDLPSAALEFQKTALRLAEKLGQPQTISRYNTQLGLIYERLRDFPTAIKHIRIGLEAGGGMQQAITAQDIENYGLLHLGRVLRKVGNHREALGALDQAAKFCREDGWGALSYQIAKERLQVQIALGDTGSAQQELARVLQRFEENRRKIRSENLRNSFFNAQQDIYDVAIKFAYADLNQPEQALDYSELNRSRSLLDAGAGERETTDESGIPDLPLAAVTPPMTSSEIRRRMPAQAQILQYALLDDRLLIWLITSDSEVKSQAVNIDAAKMKGKVKAFLSRISKPSTGDDREWCDASAELRDLLISPVEAMLDQNRLLCVAPDKILNFLPYGALISGKTGKYLLEDFALIYAPSSTLFVKNTDNATKKAGYGREHLLSVGNPSFDRDLFPNLPNLDSAADEAREVSRFYDSRSLLVGKDATKQSLLAELERAEVAHLAMHYESDPHSPMLSRLVLTATGDGAPESRRIESSLAMHEIYRLKLTRARLVTLSACQTRAEEYYNGEGVIGLSRPFEAAGVPLVVSSLWPVNSDATQRLMIRFHELRKRQGLPTARALREAQRELRSQHPYYWAAFIVAGGHSPF